MSYQDLNNIEIAVFGEGIIDLIPNAQGAYQPYVGGSPYNVARALGRQQQPVAYLSPISSDAMGSLLKQAALVDDVLLDDALTVNRPTSLALVNLDEQGVPSYSLYREGIADRAYSVEHIIQHLPPKLKLFHTGSLAIIPDDVDKIHALFKELKRRKVLISVDLNVRPNVVTDHAAYIKALHSLVPYCDILKASDEDLRFMGISDWQEEAQKLLQTMQGGLVAITSGDKGAWIANANGYVELPAYQVDEVKDTVGAGDCFHAGLLSAIYANQLLDQQGLNSCSEATLKTILSWASACAAINVTRNGCNPPTPEEVGALINS